MINQHQFNQVIQEPIYYLHLSSNDQEDRTLALRLLKLNGMILYYMSALFKNDDELIFTALKQNPNLLKYQPYEYLVSQRMIDLSTPENLEKIDEKIKDASMIYPLDISSMKFHQAMKLVKQDGLLLQYMPYFQNHMILVYFAIQQNPKAIYFAKERLKNHTDLLLLALKKSPKLLWNMFINYDLCNVDDLALLIISNHHDSIFQDSFYGQQFYEKYIGQRSQQDLDFVKDIMHLNIDVLNYRTYFFPPTLNVVDSFLNDLQWVLAYIDRSQHLSIVKYLPQDLQKDAAILERLDQDQLVINTLDRKDQIFLPFLNRRFRDDFEIGKKAIAISAQNLKYLSARLKDNDELVALAISKDVEAIEFASKRLKSHPTFFLSVCYPYLKDTDYSIDDFEWIKAILNRFDHLKCGYSSSGDHDDYDDDYDYFKKEQVLFRLRYCRNEALILKIIQYGFKIDIPIKLCNRSAFMLKAILYSAALFSKASRKLQTSRSFIKKAVLNNPYVFQYISKKYRDDDEIVLIVFQLNQNLLNYASDRLKEKFKNNTI